ncbi:MAG: tetratricopeptide repeat protein [Saprospiraceae bacterium]|nr:tetratricopeptide repeat protein [Saprospiraceae bacterium]
MRSLFIFIVSILSLNILFWGCTKQTLITKPYHSLTGRYNAYYNANMRLMESFDLLNKQHQDNYNRLLHMYPYAAVEDVSSVNDALDVTITKSARNIKLHSIGNWTDDSYFLMGKAEFLKKEYERCANTFKFIVDKYHPENVAKELAKLKKESKKKKRKKKKRKKKKRKKKKRKKKKTNNEPEPEDEEPINYGIKHRPIRYNAMLWLSKAYIELGQFDEAGYFLRQLESDLQVPYKLRPQIQAVIAYSWITQKEYFKAIEPLELAIRDTKRKTIKNRYVYLLGQIYQMQENNQLAMEQFHKVLRLKPSYEMEFNARLNMVKNAASATGKKVVDPEIALKRMLRDSKNEEYKDQIYFSLAQIELKEGKTEKGILTLKESLKFSSSNAQRTEGCLMLAKLFYEKDDFVQAFAYYDSTVMFMKKNDERYVMADMFKRRLTGVATNMIIVLDKDSMRVVGAWKRPKQERWAILGMENESKIAPELTSNKGKESEEKINFKKSNSFTPRSPMPSRGGNRTTKGPVSISETALQKSKFPLYNATLKKKGEREFEKRWSTRAWVDNWRQSERGEEDIEIENGEELVTVPKTQKEIDEYLKKKGVPMTDQEEIALIKQLCEAMFKAAEHYREDLGRKDKALQLINRLVNSYPDNSYAVEAMFLAYNIYFEEKNIPKVNFYKNEILNKYPDSNIAKVLSDPNFANSVKIKYESINRYFDSTYTMIQEGQAQKALDRVRALPNKFGENYEMKARFAILEAMCVGGIKGEKDYIKALKVIVTSFPDSKEEIQAKAMIAILNKNKSSKDKKTLNINTDEFMQKGDLVPYKLNLKTKHLVLIVFENKKTKINQHRAPVTTFNNKFYATNRLSTSSILVDGGIPSLTVRAFANGDLAMKYVVDARSNPEFLTNVKGFKIYAISQQNYNLALSTQKFFQYIDFFEKNYR